MIIADYVVIVLLVTMAAFSIVSVVLGVKRYREGNRGFQLSMLFTKVNNSKASGPLLIAEAILSLIIGVCGGIYWFIK